jgi:hypothetical protein
VLITYYVERSLKGPAQSLSELLESRKIEEYVKPEKDLITVNATTLVSDAFKVSFNFVFFIKL